MKIRQFWQGSLFVLGVLCLLLLPSSAQAQYKNIGLGVNIGFQNTFNQQGEPGAEAGTLPNLGYGIGPSYLTIGIEASWRLDSAHWVWMGDTEFGFHACNTSQGDTVGVCKRGSTPITLLINTSIRYLFLTDEIRPYIDIGFAYWQVIGFSNQNLSSFGPTASLGLEWFFRENLSLSLRFRYGLQLVVGDKGLHPFHHILSLINFSAYL